MTRNRTLAGLCALALLAAIPASGQTVAAPPAADDAAMRVDLSDLRTRLFDLIGTFDHAHASRAAIEATMGVSFTAQTDPSKTQDWRLANGLVLKGYEHLGFTQYFNPDPHKSFTGGRSVALAPTYAGEFDVVPFAQDEASCLSLHEIRDRLTTQGWTVGISSISTHHNPDGSLTSTTRVALLHNQVRLDLVVHGIPSGVDVPPDYAATVSQTKTNDCVLRLELTDGAA